MNMKYLLDVGFGFLAATMAMIAVIRGEWLSPSLSGPLAEVAVCTTILGMICIVFHMVNSPRRESQLHYGSEGEPPFCALIASLAITGHLFTLYLSQSTTEANTQYNLSLCSSILLFSFFVLVLLIRAQRHLERKA